MKTGLWDYIRAAFNARPIGMFIPPNWIGLGAFGLLGLIQPGFWLIGAGLELGYLYALATNARFQNVVNGSQMLQSQRQWQAKVSALVSGLSPEEQQRYRTLEGRCQAILQQQNGGAAPDLQAQGEGLGRLLWIHLRLLLTRQSIMRLLKEVAGAQREGPSLDERMELLEKQLKNPQLSEDLKKSLGGQLEILQQRQQSQREAREKLAFLEAELTRIQEQIELIREQAIVSTDPAAVSQRIDQIAATLGGTNQWIREQQQIYGKVEDLLAEPPAVVLQTQPAAKEAQ